MITVGINVYEFEAGLLYRELPLNSCKMLTFEDISYDLLCLVFSGLNLSLVEPSAWKPLTLTVQLIKYVNSLNT
jgi:hypothetical protein